MRPLDIASFARSVSRKRLHLFLDFDGTLAPHVPDGRLARPLPRALAALKRLAGAPGVRVSLVSGRPVPELMRLAPVIGAAYAGNHGLVIDSPDGHFQHPESGPIRRALDRAQRLLAPLIPPGAVLEHNGLSLALNLGSRARLGAGQEVVTSTARRLAGWGLRWNAGFLGWDLTSDAPWGKGEALEHLLAGTPRALPVAVGDGWSDESMFRRVAGRGLAVKVGRPPSSAAARLAGPQAVADLLEAL